MVYCAWNAFREPTIVWVHGAISDDEGQGEGGFVIGRSETPFGPYEMLPEPVMTSAGAPWEVDEMNTPQLLFEVNTAYLYYSGADYAKGWWTMLATTDWFR